MKIVVLCHAVPDLGDLSVSRSQDRVFEKGKRLLHGADAVAVEVALRRRAAGDEVIVLAWGEEGNREVLRKPLAMGADRAAWTAGDAAAAARVLGADAVCGGAASPLGANVQPARVAAALGLGADRGWVVAADAAVPRIPNALAVMKAAKRPIEVIEAPAGGLLVRRWATLLAAEEA